MKSYLLFMFLLTLQLMACTETERQLGEKASVEEVVESLFQSMMEADKSAMTRLLADDLSYGHYSGIIQNKDEFIDDIISGRPIKLTNIRAEDQTIVISENVATVRHVFLSDGVDTVGESTPIRIGNCLVFHHKNGKWKLLVRQAYRL